MPTRRLELGVEAPQLVVHPVDVGAQRAQLVSVLDLHAAREVARRDRGEAVVDVLDRPDQRPRQDEPQQQGEHERARRDADEQRRELAKELAFRAIRSWTSSRVPFASPAASV